MRYRLCHRPRRGVLRAAEGQRSNRCRLCIPALDRYHVRAHGKGAARQDSAHHHGLRPLGVARRLGVPVELPAAWYLLDGRRHSPAAHRQEGRRVRQAQGQEDRAGLSRLALRQGADRPAAEAREDARIRDPVPAGHASGRRAEGDLAADPPEPSRLRAAVGLGRDEFDRHQGGGRGRLSAREDVRRVVVGGGAGRAARRGRCCRLQLGDPSAHLRSVQGARGSQEVPLRQGPGRGEMGGDGRNPLRARIDQRHAWRRGDPHGAGAVRQEAAHRRAGALGPREPRHHRRTHQAARLRGRAAADQGVLRRSRGHAHGPHPDLGRQEMERHVGVDHVRRLGDRSDGEGSGGQVRGRKEAHARVSRDQLMSVSPDRNLKEAAPAPPPLGAGTASDRVAAAPTAAPILSVNNIEVVYDHVILVLKGVSLEVAKGEIVALLGANGAGKSTTLKAISNLLAAERGEVTKGSIVFDGEEVHARSPNELVRRGCIQVMERRHCFAHLWVEENLLTGAFTRGGAGAAIRGDLDRVYSYFPRLKVRRAAIAGYISGGEQQMCAIGRALMSRPQMILLDEPSMGLAPQLVEEIFAIVGDLNAKEGVSFLLAEQNTRMALKYARYGYVLENGRVVLDGEAKALGENEDVKEFYLGVAEGRRKSFREGKHYRRRKRWLA